jgi:DNA gyrase subunit B
MSAAWKNFLLSNPDERERNRSRLDTAQKKYWGDAAHRTEQSKRTSAYFEAHPEAKELRSKQSRDQWADRELLDWRSEKTKTQWTPAFRAKRREALDRTYFQKAMRIFHDIFLGTGEVDERHYEKMRVMLKDRSVLKAETVLNRFFGGNQERMRESVMHYNHRIRSVEAVDVPMDVYDLEVPSTHNFALAAGVFVHNSAKQGRNRENQAILPLRGKILNVERARLDKMLANNELKSLVIALGTNIGEMFNIEELRYDRVIIMTDADVDGAHIRTLLLTLFYRHFPELIRQGHVYIAQPPLYRVGVGKEFRYAFTEEEKMAAIDELAGARRKEPKGPKEPQEPKVVEEAESEETVEAMTVGGVKVNIQRYKGLGEMNPEQLWETTMNPETRVMKRVTVEDAEKADETFDILMGEDVSNRKHFIQTHAKNVQNLDV